MPPVGKQSDVLTRAMDRLGKLSDSLAPTIDAQKDALHDTIDEYSRLKPRDMVFEQAGDDTTRRIVLSTVLLASGWKKGSNTVVSVETVTAAGTNDETTESYDLEDWQQRIGANGDDLLFLATAVNTGSTLRLVWDGWHVVHETDPTLTTIPENDAEPFVSLLASKLAEWVARKASDSANASLGTDQVDMEPISERWRRRAKELRDESFYARLTPTSATTAASGTSVEWATDRDPWHERISH